MLSPSAGAKGGGPTPSKLTPVRLRLQSSCMILSQSPSTNDFNTQLLNKSKIHKTIHVHSRSTAERALRFSRAVRRTLISQQGSADLEITETEEYLGFLRAKKALIEIRVTEADEQIGVVREILDQNRLSEVLLSDDGDDGQTFSASSSSGVDTSTEPPSSEDPTGWPAESFISCNLDSPSIRSKRQKVMEGLIEKNGDRWDGPLSDEYDSDYE